MLSIALKEGNEDTCTLITKQLAISESNCSKVFGEIPTERFPMEKSFITLGTGIKLVPMTRKIY